MEVGIQPPETLCYDPFRALPFLSFMNVMCHGYFFKKKDKNIDFNVLLHEVELNHVFDTCNNINTL